MASVAAARKAASSDALRALSAAARTLSFGVLGFLESLVDALLGVGRRHARPHRDQRRQVSAIARRQGAGLQRVGEDAHDRRLQFLRVGQPPDHRLRLGRSRGRRRRGSRRHGGGRGRAHQIVEGVVGRRGAGGESGARLYARADQAACRGRHERRADQQSDCPDDEAVHAIPEATFVRHDHAAPAVAHPAGDVAAAGETHDLRQGGPQGRDQERDGGRQAGIGPRRHGAQADGRAEGQKDEGDGGGAKPARDDGAPAQIMAGQMRLRERAVQAGLGGDGHRLSAGRRKTGSP